MCIRDRLDVADVVRGHDDCAAVAGNCAEELHNAVGRGWVEVAGRFVGENHLRVVQQLSLIHICASKDIRRDFSP